MKFQPVQFLSRKSSRFCKNLLPLVILIHRESSRTFVRAVWFWVAFAGNWLLVPKVSPIGKIKWKIVIRFSSISLESFNNGSFPPLLFLNRWWLICQTVDTNYYGA